MTICAYLTNAIYFSWLHLVWRIPFTVLLPPSNRHVKWMQTCKGENMFIYIYIIHMSIWGTTCKNSCPTLSSMIETDKDIEYPLFVSMCCQKLPIVYYPTFGSRSHRPTQISIWFVIPFSSAGSWYYIELTSIWPKQLLHGSGYESKPYQAP